MQIMGVLFQNIRLFHEFPRRMQQLKNVRTCNSVPKEKSESPSHHANTNNRLLLRCTRIIPSNSFPSCCPVGDPPYIQRGLQSIEMCPSGLSFVRKWTESPDGERASEGSFFSRLEESSIFILDYMGKSTCHETNQRAMSVCINFGPC